MGSLILLAAMVGAAEPPLAWLRWAARPLLVFAPAADHGQLAAQRDALRGTDADRADRALVLIEVVGAKVGSGTPLPGHVTADRLRTRYAVPDDAFAVILIGLDGTTKLRSDDPVDARALFDRIDAMPMRREELRRRGDARSRSGDESDGRVD